MTLAKASSALYTVGFSKYRWRYSCYGSPDIGQVIKQIPAAGKRVVLTTRVKIYLQNDNCTATVPNVVGMSKSAAISTLEQAGFRVYWIFECLGSSTNGAVVTQSPSAGTSYSTGKTVSIQLQADNCSVTATATPTA